MKKYSTNVHLSQDEKVSLVPTLMKCAYEC